MSWYVTGIKNTTCEGDPHTNRSDYDKGERENLHECPIKWDFFPQKGTRLLQSST